jgi:DNA-binding PadR family transcriptional regulator
MLNHDVTVSKKTMVLMAIYSMKEASREEIIHYISVASGQELTNGTVYPALARLAHQGLVASRWVWPKVKRHSEPRVLYYSLTYNGKKACRENARVMKNLLMTLK